ncbi:hypothetical protein LC653_45150 [Nostoc sp. CHAB 5784]|nr:hypothetical protein [Nostoc mirabile CHAB5784]
MKDNRNYSKSPDKLSKNSLQMTLNRYPKLKLPRLIEQLGRLLCIPFFPGAVVPPTDPRYLTLVTGFNQRFKGNPKYVQLCGDAKQVLQAVQTAVNNQYLSQFTRVQCL